MARVTLAPKQSVMSSSIRFPGLVVLPCSSTSCKYGARCSFTRGYPECKCPTESECPVEDSPVCGSDGRNYPNECVLIARACKMRKEVTVEYQGPCGTVSTVMH